MREISCEMVAIPLCAYAEADCESVHVHLLPWHSSDRSDIRRKALILTLFPRHYQYNFAVYAPPATTPEVFESRASRDAHLFSKSPWTVPVTRSTWKGIKHYCSLRVDSVPRCQHNLIRELAPHPAMRGRAEPSRALPYCA